MVADLGEELQQDGDERFGYQHDTRPGPFAQHAGPSGMQIELVGAQGPHRSDSCPIDGA